MTAPSLAAPAPGLAAGKGTEGWDSLFLGQDTALSWALGRWRPSSALGRDLGGHAFPPVTCGPDSQAHKNPLQVLGPHPRRQTQQVLGQPRTLHSSGSEAPLSCRLEKIGQVSTQGLPDGSLM